jgi:peptidoglycan/xylan/chitin deacetylase (PgdA/CDA1 family)
LLDAPDVHLQLSATQSAVYAAAHVTPMWFRPPFGDVDGRVASLAARLGLQTVLWSVDPRDWTRPGTAVIVERVLAAVRPGSVVIMHDGGGDRSETVAALPSILRALRDRGYQCVTLSDLFFPGQRATPAPPAPSHSGGQGHPHKRRAPGSPGLGGS